MLQIRNARLPDDRLACIQVVGGYITGITEQPIDVTSLDFDYNAHGCLVVPGGIDGHVHLRFPGNPRSETIPNFVAAALRGGTTTVFGMPNTDPPITSLERAANVFGQIGDQPIEIHGWFGAMADNHGEIRQIARFTPMRRVKVYSSETTGNLIVRDPEQRLGICEVATESGLIIGVHAQNQDLIERNRAGLGRDPVMTDHCTIQDTEVEVSSVREWLQHQRDTGCVLYFCHISSPEAVELIYDAKQAGARVHVEVCVQHLFLCSQHLKGMDGWRAKMNPSVRTLQQLVRLRELVMRPGYVDVISTDHASHEEEKKRQLKYNDVPSGMPGVQTRMLMMCILVMVPLDVPGLSPMTVSRYVELTSGNAAKIFDLNKGRIEVGADADLAVIDIMAKTKIEDRDMLTRCGWTPFHGCISAGRIRATVARGKLYTF